jgi:hypothetical protein
MSDATAVGATSVVPGMTLAPAIDQMTAAQASARLAELKNNPEWRDAHIRGDQKARSEFEALHKRMTATEQEARANVEMDQGLNGVSEFAGLEQGVLDQIKAGQAVSPAERRLALDAKKRFMSDEALVKKYLAGDREARRQMMLISTIIAAPVKQNG